MADVMANIGRGRLYQRVLDGADLIIVLLKVAEADDTLRDYDTLAALLAGANTEADFTSYARKVVANASITPQVDDTGNVVNIDIPDQTWSPAGGALNNTLVKLLICIDGAADANRIPITLHDFAVTTDGSDLTAQIPTTPDGFYQSA